MNDKTDEVRFRIIRSVAGTLCFPSRHSGMCKSERVLPVDLLFFNFVHAILLGKDGTRILTIRMGRFCSFRW